MRKLPQLISRCYETHMNSFEKKREVKTSNCKNKFLSVFVVVVFLQGFDVFVHECHTPLNKLVHLQGSQHRFKSFASEYTSC